MPRYAGPALVNPVVARQRVQRKLQHKLCRTLRPVQLPLDRFQSFQVRANVDQDAGKLWADRAERQSHPLTSCQ
jgi:hypothetical protein